MAAVIGLHGLKQGHDFKLSSNIKDAGNSHDLVYTGGGQRYFLQLKHSYNPDKTLIKKKLGELLGYCLKFHLKIKNYMKFKNMANDDSYYLHEQKARPQINMAQKRTEECQYLL